LGLEESGGWKVGKAVDILGWLGSKASQRDWAVAEVLVKTGRTPKNRFLDDFRSRLALAMLRVDMGWSWIRVP
jgi:hypothetical protein